MKHAEKKPRWELHKYAVSRFEYILGEAPNYKAAVQPLSSHLTKHPSNMNKTCLAQLEKDKLISDGVLHINTQVSADQQKLTSAVCEH